MPTHQWAVTDQGGLTATRSVTYAVATPPPTSAGMPPLIGSSSRAGDWDERKAMLEATGGKLEARRIFIGSITDSANTRSLLQSCVSQGLVPVISFQPGAYSWAQIANGAADSAITAMANTVKGVMGTRPIYMTINHEPDKQNDAGKTVGEGGDGADFGRMLARAADLIRAVLPQAKVGPILNGWWFSAQSRGFSDAEIAYWMTPAQLAKFDYVAADHYAALNESEPSLTRIQRHAAWMGRVGFVGSMGIGETNGWTPSDLAGAFGFAKTSERFRGGFVLLWNSTVPNATPTDWKPVHETGLLDDFQEILRAWRG